MITRRGFARRLAAGLAAAIPTEATLAQGAAIAGQVPENAVWLNANENPEGPPPSAIAAMLRVAPEAGRYHFQEFRDFYAALAASENLERNQVLAGAGSTEIIHSAIEAFTGPDRPLIQPDPTFEGAAAVAGALGRRVVAVPLTDRYAADVRRLAAEADKAGGGLIYLCNPNNPTSSITPRADMRWLAANLPRNTVLLVDEAYIHFAESAEAESALADVRQGRNVVVARTFSKIYGMAGLRVGFGCAPPPLIRSMAPFPDLVISIVSARAAAAALAEAGTLVPERRARFARRRKELCDWLREKGLSYIEPHGNFVMVNLGRPAGEFIPRMVAKGVVPGRPFPALSNMLRVTLGTDAEMARFRDVFWEAYSA